MGASSLPYSDLKSRDRVVIGMSGGVDSSAAAGLLLQQGFEVVGVTLKLWASDCSNRAEDKCCGPDAVRDARAVCERLGMPFYLVDEAAEFQSRVIHYFAAEYRAGRTPNPCVMCNQHLKFGVLIDRADQLGARFIATGHFARIEELQGRFVLRRGRDLRKDQTYFLFSLRQEQLARTLFPLGELTKAATREVAQHCRLKTANKPESMEICFVPDGDYGSFLRGSGLVQEHAGEVVDLQGNVLGYHGGIEFFTIGQRRGLGIASKAPLYVLELDSTLNRVVVGPGNLLECREFTVRQCNWIPFDHPPSAFEALAKIRYNHPGATAIVQVLDATSAKVCFHEPQRAVAPGQAAVFYQDDLVVGGGWIAR